VCSCGRFETKNEDLIFSEMADDDKHFAKMGRKLEELQVCGTGDATRIGNRGNS
jgi:hypothetical protein